MFQIAIASGKGGTGKTTVATNLATIAATSFSSVAYLDCDVEEPNGHLFLKPEIHLQEEVGVAIPEVDRARCTLCGACSDLCQYSAIVKAGNSLLTFPELCHSCGGCVWVCPEKAITEVDRPMGVLETGTAGSIQFAQGRLNVGEVMSVPLIHAVKHRAQQADLRIIDAPPGASCPVIATVSDVDFCLLVTEPTPFGLHDLKLAVEMVRALEVPFAVVLNRAGMGDQRVESWCAEAQVPLIGRIPHDERIARAYSRGEMIVNAAPEYIPLFEGILAASKRVQAGKGVQA